MSEVESSVGTFSRLLSWEVWNFMSIEHGKMEFDEKNIINIKGYNDSGKSAMMQALKILLANTNPTKQVGFIQDDKDYFRVLATFSDGVQILRDKYINGQSLYEMYHNGKLIFTTKSGNSLTKITEVPEPIQNYLGLIMYDGSCLNARSCFEKGIGTETTGSENYKMFNVILKSEEIATASALLNNDKNKLASDISTTDSELLMQKNLISDKKGLTLEMVDFLKAHDLLLDTQEKKEEALRGIASTAKTLSSIVVSPEMKLVDTTQLVLLDELSNLRNSLSSIIVTPEVGIIDVEQLNALASMKNIKESLSNIQITPEVSSVDNSQLQTLCTLHDVVDSIKSLDADVVDADSRLTSLNSELEALQSELIAHGVKMVKCPGCGVLFNPDEQHVH